MAVDGEKGPTSVGLGKAMRALRLMEALVHYY